jgi:hypothetical protein
LGVAVRNEAILGGLGVRDDTLSPAQRGRLDRAGYLTLPDLLAPAVIAALLDRLVALVAERTAAGDYREGGTRHVGGLVDEPLFDRVWLSPGHLAAVRHLLGTEFTVGGLHYRAPLPGHGAQALHPDWAGPPPASGWAVATMIVALTDFTPDNGATRVVTGSHLVHGFSAATDTASSHPDQALLTCPAGTAVVFNGHLWHSGTRNRSTGLRHALLVTSYRRGTMRGGGAEPSDATLDRLGDAAYLLM